MTKKIQLLLVLNLLLSIDSTAIEIHHFKVEINQHLPIEGLKGTNVTDHYEPYLDEAVLILPDSYSKTGIPTRLVYCAHGAGGGVDTSDWFLQHFPVIDTLLKQGFAVFDVNGGPSLENMGGSWVVQSAIRAYGHIVTHFNVYEDIFVIGFSMGGLASSNFVSRYSNKVIAHAMLSPVLDLKSQAWNNPWYVTTRENIARAYNFHDASGTTWEPDKIIGWNPIEINTYQIDGDIGKLYSVPLKIWHGERDNIVNASSSIKFHQYILRSGGDSTLRLIDSDSHGLSVGSPYINHELVLFLNRFNF